MPPPISLRALRDATRRIGELGALRTETPESPESATIQMHVGRITSTSKTEDRYPGTRYDYFADTDNAASPPAGSYVARETIWIKSRRGETLEEDVNYDLVLVGVRASDGIAIYAVVSPPASSGSATFAGCKARHDQLTQSITTITETTLTFNSEQIDTDAFHDPSTNNDRLTIPSGLGGIYVVTAQATFQADSTGTIRRLRIVKNGSVELAVCVSFPLTSSAGVGLNCSVLFSFSAGDYVTASVFHDASGSLLIAHDNGFGVPGSWLSIHRWV